MQVYIKLLYIIVTYSILVYIYIYIYIYIYSCSIVYINYYSILDHYQHIGITFETNRHTAIKQGLSVWANTMQDAFFGELGSRTKVEEEEGAAEDEAKKEAGPNFNLSPDVSCDKQTKLPWDHGPLVNELLVAL